MKRLACILLLSLVAFAALAQVTKIDAIRLVKPNATNSTVLTTNGSGAVAWGKVDSSMITDGTLSPSDMRLPSAQVAYGSGSNTVTSEAAFNYNSTTNRLSVDSTTGNRLDLTQATGNANHSLRFHGNQERVLSIDNDTRNTATYKAPFTFSRGYYPGLSAAGDNEVWMFGINEGDGSQPHSDRAQMGIRMESNFQNTGQYRAFEFHLPQVSYPDGQNRRPIGGYFSNDQTNKKGKISFQSDDFLISDYKNNVQKITWGITENSGYDKGITFLDTARVFFGKNGKQGGGMYQRNAAGTAYMGLLYAHSDNYAVIGDDGAGVRIFPSNLELGGTAQVFPTNGFINFGKSGFPADVRIFSQSTEALRLTSSAQPTRNWTHIINSNNYALTTPAGNALWEFYDNAPAITGANNRFSVGGFGTSKFSVVQSATNSEAGMQITALSGNRYYNWMDGSDNWLLTNNSGTTKLTLAQSGDLSLNTTGFFKLATGTTAQRPTVSAAYMRHNTTTSQFEGSRDGSTWENFLMSSSTGAAWLNTGNSLSATGTFGTTSNHGWNILANNSIRGSVTATGNFQFGQQGGSGARVTVATSGREAAQLLLKSAGSNGDSVNVFVGNGLPGGSLTAVERGSVYVDGNHCRMWISQADNSNIWYPVQMGKDTITVTAFVLADNYVGSSGADNLSYFRVPDWLNGDRLVDYSVSVFSNGYSAGSTVFRLQHNTSDLCDVTFGTSTLKNQPFGCPQVLADGDLLTLDTGTDTATGTLTGLTVTLLIERATH